MLANKFSLCARSCAHSNLSMFNLNKSYNDLCFADGKTEVAKS